MTAASSNPDRRPFVLAAFAALAVSFSLVSLPGCMDSSPPSVSPTVAADSEEARKALAEDQAQGELRKQKEAKAASRKRKGAIPVEAE